jgi:hypothetical protein
MIHAVHPLLPPYWGSDMAKARNDDQFVFYADDEWVSDHKTLQEANRAAEDWAKDADVGSSGRYKVEIFKRVKIGWVKNILEWE